MPDLLGHTAAGYIMMRRPWRRYCLPSVLFAGCILPDVSRAAGLAGILVGVRDSQFMDAASVLHAPIVLFFEALLFSQFFVKGLRLRAFGNLTAGFVSHLLLDALQKGYHATWLYAFPFTMKPPVQGLFWSDDSWQISSCLLALAIPLWFYDRREKNKHGTA